MKADLSKLNTDVFLCREGRVADEPVYLVEPHYSGGPNKWNAGNLHFRSSMWNARGELISAGFPKFFNVGEKTDLAPTPEKMEGVIRDKKDGSLLILSKYEAELIARTRGTFSYEILSNGREVPGLLAKHALPEYMRDVADGNGTVPFSLLFEWTTPSNKIVLDYGDEPQLWLIGGVYHEDYSLFHQNEIDELGKRLHIPTPERYNFDTVEEFLAVTKALEGREGHCWYHGRNLQSILKAKGERYLSLHAMVGEVATLEKVIDIWIAAGQPNYAGLYNYIQENRDHEIAEYARPFISRICDARKEVSRILQGFEDFCVKNRLRDLSSERAQADIVLSAYGQTNRAGYVFNVLRNKPIGAEGIKKLMFQVLKK